MHWSFYGGYRYLKTAIKAPSDSNFSSSLHCFQTLTLPVTLLSASVNTHLQSVPWEPGHTTSNAVATAWGMVNVACRFPLPGPPAGAQWRLHCQWVWSHDLYWPMVCVACHSQKYKGVWFSSLFSLLQEMLRWWGWKKWSWSLSHWKESCPRELLTPVTNSAWARNKHFSYKSMGSRGFYCYLGYTNGSQSGDL